MNDNFAGCAHTLLLPDFAMLYEYVPNGLERNANTVKLCFRQNIEKVLSNSKQEEIKSSIMKRFGSFREFDTVQHTIIPIYKRRKYVKQTLREFEEAQLVITDRLHAMIMCALTGTACVAYDNSSHKVKNVYKWIESLDFIRVIDEEAELMEAVDAVVQTSKKDNVAQYHKLDLGSYYEELRRIP